MTRCLLLVLAACAAPKPSPVANHAPTAPPKPGIRASDVFAHPELIGTTVVVDIYEGAYDEHHSTAAAPGHYDIGVVDVGWKRFDLAPPPDGKLPAIHGPVRVTGQLLATDKGVQLVAREVVPLAYPEPLRVASTQELDLMFPSGTYVEVTADLDVGAEWVQLDDRVSLDSLPDASWRCFDDKRPTKRVRVRGFAYTRSGEYGHMGMSRAAIMATEVVALDPLRPGCR